MGVPDYNDRRYGETRRERHGVSKRTRDREAKGRKVRIQNREFERFGQVNWDAYQHDQMYDMIWRADLGEMSARAEKWSRLAGRIEATTSEVQRVVEQVMGAWRGQAAVRSAESNTRLMRWAGEASQTAGKIAEGMATYTEAVARAQKHMPEPGFATAERNFREGYTVTSTGGPSTAILLKELLSDGMVSHEEARSRKAEAVRVMSGYETESRGVHDTMPHFTPARPTTKEPPAETWSTPPDPVRDPTPNHPGNPPHETGAVAPPPGVGVGGNASTVAAGFADPVMGGPGGPGSGSGSGGPGGGGYGGGLGSLGSGGSDIVRNSPGYGSAGGPGGLAGAGPVPGRGAAAGAGGPFGARGAGAPGAFGGMPVGSGAQGEEDKEHRNKYDEGMDFFDDLPPAYPSVFGA
jgi:uncharacterized protein YukE